MGIHDTIVVSGRPERVPKVGSWSKYKERFDEIFRKPKPKKHKRKPNTQNKSRSKDV